MTELNSTTLVKRISGAIGVAALVSLMGLPAVAQTTPRPGTSNQPGVTRPGATPTTPNPNRPGATSATFNPIDQEFLVMAIQGNNAEIQTSQLALQRSNNNTVRQYAQRMIQEHTAANRELTRLANQNNVSVPTGVDSLSQAIATRLSQLSGAEFDRAYMGVQTNAHLRAISLYQTQIDQGQNPGLTAYANQQLPNIRDHYEVASQQVPGNRAENVRPGGNQNMQQPVR
jgi:putative membrane protein